MSPEARRAYFASVSPGYGSGSGNWATINSLNGSAPQTFSPHLQMPFVKGYKPKGANDKISLRRFR